MRLKAAIALAALLSASRVQAAANVCTNPGKDGPASVSGVVNSYYPGVTSPAGSSSVRVGALDTSGGGSATPIAAGDLLLIIQMQDADIAATNDSGYGGSFAGGGQTALNNAGRYEYAEVSPTYAGGATVSLTAPLKNSYRTSAATAGAGQRTFQVIRVPQYSSATLSGTSTAPAWNGATGGVFAMDVGGQLNWGGGTIDVTGRGFRGGAALYLSGGAATQPAYSTNDYATTLAPNAPTIAGGGSATVGPNSGAHGSKGEGIAGTPRFLFIPQAAGASVNGSGVVVDTGADGYPGGYLARGAPGNAGGGGTDGNPSANDQNTGGGGGGGYANGGVGGFGWTPGTPPGSNTGGVGGAGVPMSAALLTLGGGGGSGTSNNATGTPNYALATSGAAGGGMVLVRAKTIIGSGTINAAGASGNPSVCNDASGGGGGGGAIVVFASGNSGNVGTLTARASGGGGGSNTGNGTGENSGACGAFNNEPHGPGGGGGGGFVALSSVSSATILVAGGVNGTTSPSPTSTSPYGSASSPGGYQISTVTATDLPGATPSPLCFPLLTETKTALTANAVQGGTAKYSITVGNAAGYGQATGVTLSDALPAGFTLSTTDAVVTTGGAVRTAVANPIAGTNAPSWGAFTVPAGGVVRVDFTVAIAAATPGGTYQNSATVTYDDPTRTAAGQTATPGGTYAGGGFVLGSNYDSSSSTADDVTVRAPAAIVKSFNPASATAGGTTQVTVAISNPNATALTAAAFTDVFPAGMTAVGGAITVGGAGCTGFVPTTLGAAATSFAQSGGTVPANTTCTFSAQVSIATSATLTNTIAAGSFTSAQGVSNTAAASATLLSRPTIAKAFSPAAVAPNANATLTFTIVNPNAGQALTAATFLDTFPGGMTASGGAVTVGGAGCTGFAPATTTAGAASFQLTAGTLPAGGTCTVSFAVKAGAGNYANTAGGVSTAETAVAGPPSAAAQLGVGVIAVNKSFAPARIAPGGTSTVTLQLVNPTVVAQTAGALTDTLTGMAISANQTVGGTCTGTTPTTLTGGATTLSFTGINIPASSSCTVTFIVTAAASGSKNNVTSGVATALLTAGPPSNAATLVVAGSPTISEAFAPSTVQTGQATTLTFTIVNGDTIPLTGASFTDTLAGGLSIATSGAASGTCPGASSLSFTAGATSLSFTGLTLPPGAAGCTVTVQVAAAGAGSYPNAAGAVSSAEAPTGAAAASATLIVAASPTIAKAFATSPISQNGTSALTFTLTNPNAIALSGGAFTDTLSNMQISAAGPATGSCGGAGGNSFTAGQTGALAFSGLTIPASGSCTVSVVVTSSTSGSNPNTTGGVTTAQTPVAGAGSNTATLQVSSPPSLSLGFSPGVILTGASSTLTVTLTNANAAALTSVAFSDTLDPNVKIAATGAAGGTCVGAGGNSFTVGASSLSFAGITVPASGNCTLTVVVTSGAPSPSSGWADATSGATSAQTPVAGAAASPAYLVVVGYASIGKAFSPAAIAQNGVSTLTFTLTNPNAVDLTSASFSDTFPANLTTTSAAQNYIGAGRGTCTGAIPSAAGANAPVAAVSFAGISIPANSSCTVMVDVTSGTLANLSNTATGVKAAQTGASAGPASNTATLSVGGLGVAKSFTPATVGVGETSTIVINIVNNSGFAATNVAISDALVANLTILAGATNSCGGTFTAAGSTITLTNGAVATGSSCALSVPVSASAAGSYSNTTGTLAYRVAGFNVTGPTSNTAVLTAVLRPTIAKAFSPSPVDAFRNSTLTFTLTNPNASAQLTRCGFTDALVGFAVSSPPAIGGTCVGTTATPALAQGQTSLSLSVPALSPGSCTISLPVTSGAAGTYSNTASGVKCDQTVAAGAASNTATVTFNKLPLQFQKTANVVKAAPGSTVTYTLSYANPNPGMALQNIVITDATPQFTRFSAASCGVLPASLTSCTVSAPAVGQPGTVTWTLGGTLDPGASGAVTLSVTVN